MIPRLQIIDPASLTLDQTAYLGRLLKQQKLYWVWSVGPNFESCRQLHPCRGAAERLEFASMAVPIYQIFELPDV